MMHCLDWLFPRTPRRTYGALSVLQQQLQRRSCGFVRFVCPSASCLELSVVIFIGPARDSAWVCVSDFDVQSVILPYKLQDLFRV